MSSLHPDLQRHFAAEDGLLHHPLLIRSLGPSQFQAASNEYLSIKKEADTVRETKDWEKYVFLHARPYRLRALKRCCYMGLAGSAFWKLVGEVWCDSENIFQNRAHWRSVWSSEEPGRTDAMNAEEKLFLNKLAMPVPVWRGSDHRIHTRSLSWTTNREKALFFANRRIREGHACFLASGIVQRVDVFATFLRRNEFELVCRKATISKVEKITR